MGSPALPDRILEWDGCLNVRDLGGLPLADGGTNRGVLVRADSVTRLSAKGREALRGYGVRRIVDLRAGDERLADEVWPEAVEVVSVPISPGGPDDPLWREFAEIFDAAADADHGLRDVYLAFLERWPALFAAAVAALAASTDGATVLQCGAGRDRTGLVAALLLESAGAAPASIAMDYALTPPIEGHPGATAWVMAQVLAEMSRRHGGARAYLRNAGLDDETLAAAVAPLLRSGQSAFGVPGCPGVL
ncbi:MAG TPA: tyrosine-protein phosphatase [Gaiellales bacterium]|nr:tyrosine-protein phosphatase [Gaiellales bacterium]